MKVIFLDHDGVICLYGNWGSRHKKQKKMQIKEGLSRESMIEMPIDIRFDNFDRKSVKILNDIIQKTNAEIVVSSDWKYYANLEEMGQYYEMKGIIKKPIAYTPNLSDFDPDTASLFTWRGWIERARCLEIKKWLSENTVDAWVAVDDLNMSNEYLRPGLDNFVNIPNMNEGIKQTGISNKIISYLS